MDDKLRNRLNEIIKLAWQLDWNDESFCPKKAQVCVELSSIVYEDVQEYELKKSSRIHLFASESYRKIVSSGKSNSVFSTLGEINLDARFFVVRGRYALVFGTCFDNVVILSVRGTVFRNLWDWKANVDSRKFHVRAVDNYHLFDYGLVSFDDQFFHKGFFESIVPQFASISDAIKTHANSKNDIKIVWTGHSLGGAMAAIGNAIHHSQSTRVVLAKDLPRHAVSSYTFGMPRYCGLGGVCAFASPYHIYKKDDLIPTVPLRKMGFSDCSREYELTEYGTLEPTERTDTFGLAGHIPKLLSSIKTHSIEGYANSLAKIVGNIRPGF